MAEYYVNNNKVSYDVEGNKPASEEDTQRILNTLKLMDKTNNIEEDLEESNEEEN